MTSEQQAVPVAQEAMYLIRKGGYFYRSNAQGYTSEKAAAGRYTLAEAISCSHPNGANGPRDGIDYMLADEPADLAHPCKPGEGAGAREIGSPCENCQKPVEVGQLILYYDDVGEMHADCESPFSLDYDPPKDAAPDPMILLGSPMVHVPLALLASDATQTREAEGLQEISEDDLREAIQKSIDHPGMTQNLFARKTGISRGHLSEFLSGKRGAEPAIAEPCGYRWALVHDTRATDDLTDAALNARDAA